MTKNRPEWLKSSKRLVLLLMTLSFIVLSFLEVIPGDKFFEARLLVAGAFYGAMRKDTGDNDLDKTEQDERPTH